MIELKHALSRLYHRTDSVGLLALMLAPIITSSASRRIKSRKTKNTSKKFQKHSANFHDNPHAILEIAPAPKAKKKKFKCATCNAKFSAKFNLDDHIVDIRINADISRTLCRNVNIDIITLSPKGESY